MKTCLAVAVSMLIVLSGCSSADRANISTERGLKNALKHGNIMPKTNNGYIATGSGKNSEIATDYALAQALYFCREKKMSHVVDNVKTDYKRSISEEAHATQTESSRILGLNGIADAGTSQAYISTITGHCE